MAMGLKEMKSLWDRCTGGPFGTIVYIALGFVIAVVLNAVLGLVLHTDTPVVAVFSNSMVPTYNKGDLIFVQGVDRVAVGDIIVFESGVYRYPIIHRAIAVDNGVITTQGDNNVSPDPWKTDISEVHGKAVLQIPLLGWVKVGVFELLGLA
ncbi:MAG: signal peptidase I [Candidatus Aenigmatarchaeota archaeon]